MRYFDCQREDGNCELCGLSNYGKDCRNAPTNKIAYLRHITNLTQTAFADLLDIPLRTIQNWEIGHREPPEYVIELIEYRLKDYNNQSPTD